MRLPSPLVPAILLKRVNRFAVQVSLDGRRVGVHLPNSGRLQELLQPGTRAYLVPKAAPSRKTPFDLLLVRVGKVLISADARLPNRLVAEALREGRLPPFRRYKAFTPEVRYRDCRYDFLLEGLSGRCLLEVKSVTLVEEGVALFPDAPTERGRRHLETLIRARQEGLRGAVVFVIQRPDAKVFRPHDEADPVFGEVLRRASVGGVSIHAYRCRVSLKEIILAEPLAISL